MAKKYKPETKVIFMPIDRNGQLDLGFTADTPQELVDMYRLGKKERIAKFVFKSVVDKPKRSRKRKKS